MQDHDFEQSGSAEMKLEIDVFHHFVSVDVLTSINERLDKIMATLQQVKDALDKVLADVKASVAANATAQAAAQTEHDALMKQITDLQAQVAAGGAATAADLDALLTQATAVDTALGNVPPVVVPVPPVV